MPASGTTLAPHLLRPPAKAGTPHVEQRSSGGAPPVQRHWPGVARRKRQPRPCWAIPLDPRPAQTHAAPCASHLWKRIIMSKCACAAHGDAHGEASRTVLEKHRALGPHCATTNTVCARQLCSPSGRERSTWHIHVKSTGRIATENLPLASQRVAGNAGQMPALRAMLRDAATMPIRTCDHIKPIALRARVVLSANQSQRARIPGSWRTWS